MPSADGVIRDLVVAAAQLLIDGTAWIGRRLLEIWPFLAGDGVAEALTGLARAGGSSR